MDNKSDRAAHDCAEAIFEDLNRSLPNGAQGCAIYLCEMHGQRPLPDPALGQGVSLFDGDRILVRRGLPAAMLQEVLPHELVHALAREERWECLNHLVPAGVDEIQFEESIASRVGVAWAKRWP
jgi:hypothetical protein